MKGNRILCYAESVLLSLACAWSAAACLVTAFSLTIERGWLLCLLLCLWAGLSTLLMSRKRGWWIALVLHAAILAGFWQFGAFKEQGLSLLGTLVKVYDMGYGIGIPRFLQVEPTAQDVPMGMLAMLIITCTTAAICRKKSSALVSLLMFLPLACCLVVTDTVPSVGAIFALLLCMALLMLTDNVRTESGDQGSRLTAIALIPVALCLGLMLYLIPAQGFENPGEEVRQKVLTWLEELPRKLQENNFHLPSFQGSQNSVDLSTLGAQPMMNIPVAEVVTQNGGTLYLRMQDYDTYTGTAWETTQGRQETLHGDGQNLGTVTIQTMMNMNQLLLPAFPSGETILADGAVANTDGKLRYSFAYNRNFLSAFPGDAWLTLPRSTWEWARDELNRIPEGLGTVDQTAHAVASYVASSAVYDRKAEVMAPDSVDFAHWFLREADRGYCVHFATTATVLLRAAGIPARYVTGYKVDTLPGEPARVTSNEAHAWVEYYNYGTWCWSVLEATPADPSRTPQSMIEQTEPPTEVTETEPKLTEATEPTIETTAPTAPPTTPPTTEPTEEPTQPPEPEAPPIWKELLEQLMRWLPWVLAAAAVITAVNLQRVLRIRHRKATWRKGTPNQRALAYWREISRLSRLSGTEPAEELLALAEKARYSQHTLTREELNQFSTAIAVSQIALQSKPWYAKFLYRYWFAAI